MISSRLKVIAAPERRRRPIVGPKEKTHPIGAGWVRESAALPTRRRVHTTAAQHVAHPHADRIRRCWSARQTGPLFLSPQDREQTSTTEDDTESHRERHRGRQIARSKRNQGVAGAGKRQGANHTGTPRGNDPERQTSLLVLCGVPLCDSVSCVVEVSSEDLTHLENPAPLYLSLQSNSHDRPRTEICIHAV
jgi:hypothetical protein